MHESIEFSFVDPHADKEERVKDKSFTCKFV